MPAVVSEPSCVACGGLNSTIFWSNDNRTIRRCRSCDLLFVFPQPDQAFLHQEFQSDYFIKGRAAGETRLELEFEQWRKPTLTQIVEQIGRYKSGGGKLLDVGCASGEIFERFRNDGWECYGVEPSTLAFKRATERFGNDCRVHLFNGYLADANLERTSFDVITVLESLYYMPDPRRELSWLMQLLKADGLLAIAVPGYAYQRLRHSVPIHYLSNGHNGSLTASHLFYFSDRSMRRLLEGQGFSVIDVAQLGTSSYGNSLRRFTQTTYMQFTRAIAGLTLGQVKLAPHVLYLCRKSSPTHRS